MRTKKSTILALMILSTIRLSAIEWEHINATLLFSLYNNASIGTGTGALEPSPLQFSPGASIFSYIGGNAGSYYFQPGLQLFWTIEEIRDNVPRPVGPEASAHMQVLTTSIDFPLGYLFPLGKSRLGVQVGGVLDLSFPLIKAQRGTAEPETFWKAYYETLRFVKLSLSSWLEFPVSELDRIAIGFGWIYPIANFWTDAPLDHGMRFNLTMSIPISIRK